MTTQFAPLPSDADTSVRPMRLFITGGTGVLGRALLPMAMDAGHTVIAPGHDELDLFDSAAVRRAVGDAEAVLHLATRIRSLNELDDPEAWRENDSLRAEASGVLVGAAMAATTSVYVQPSVAFVYPRAGGTDEETPIVHVAPTLQSALVAESRALAFTLSGRRGIVLRFGLLDGPGTGHDEPVPTLGATLHVADAARALLAALVLPAGIYNVCRDGERVSNGRIVDTGAWRPQL
jgi:nucleoside-diphosphate-sugar epimerase